MMPVKFMSFKNNRRSFDSVAAATFVQDDSALFCYDLWKQDTQPMENWPEARSRSASARLWGRPRSRQ